MWNLLFRYHFYICALMIIPVCFNVEEKSNESFGWMILFSMWTLNVANLVTWIILKLPLVIVIGNYHDRHIHIFRIQKKKNYRYLGFVQKEWPWKQEWWIRRLIISNKKPVFLHTFIMRLCSSIAHKLPYKCVNV